MFQAGQGTNYTMKAQRQRIPGTFKEWKEVQLAGPGPQEREGDQRRRCQLYIMQGLEHQASDLYCQGRECGRALKGEALFEKAHSLLCGK